MLDSQRQILLREIEHIENDRLVAAVLAVVNGVYHLDNGLALMDDLLLTIPSYNGQLALCQNTVVHDGMVVPTQLLASGEDVFNGYQLGATLEIVRQLDAVPALAGANELGGLYFRYGLISLNSLGLSLLGLGTSTMT